MHMIANPLIPKGIINFTVPNTAGILSEANIYLFIYLVINDIIYQELIKYSTYTFNWR
jgi:hypothetical protein